MQQARSTLDRPSLRPRRVVTAHNKQGKSVFVIDDQPRRVVTFDTIPGLQLLEIWATEDTPKIPHEGGDPTLEMTSLVPPVQGTRFRLIRFPGTNEVRPEEIHIDKAKQEFAEKAAGLAEAMEEDLAMHTTDSVDYAIVLSGEISLELDDGARVHLKPGDCVVQNGTRHAWRNTNPEACIVAGVMVGARRA